MAYPMNIFLLLAKSLRATPDIIMKTRTTEYAERKRQFEVIKKHLPTSTHNNSNCWRS